MGVDVSTYKCRIGFLNGSAVLTIPIYGISDNGLKTVGSMLFIGMLLLIAGIESNPGPISGLHESTAWLETNDDKEVRDTLRRLRNVFEEARKDIPGQSEESLQHLEIPQKILSERGFAEAGETPITRRPKVSKYDVPDSCYPRYQYTKKHAATIKDDYIELKQRISQNQKPVIDRNTRTRTTLFVFEPFKKTLFLRPADLVLRAHESCRTQQMPTNFGEELSQLYSSCPADSTVVAIERFGVEEHEPAASLLLLTEDKDDMAEFENNISSGIQVCCNEEVKVKICEMLERDLLHQMEKVYEDLDNVRFDLDNQQKTGNITCSCEGCCTCTYESIIEDIKRLRADIMGLVKRSKVPEDQKPQLSTNTGMKVDRKVIDALKKTSHSIAYCGYNLDTLYIFVDEKHPTERLKLQMDIERRMGELGISNFRVVSSHVKLYSKTVSGSGVVVKAKKKEGTEDVSATLTGFGRLTENNRLVAIISRHLAINSTDKKLYIQNGSSYLTGDIMKEIFDDIIYERAGASNEHPKILMDIAFASICDKDEELCETRYRTDKNELVTGTLCTYDQEEMDHLPVYIWGNATGLNHGFISMPGIDQVNDSVNLEHLLLIKETKGSTFCKRGDSGAMVCADDRDNYGEKVQLIAMIVGAYGNDTGLYASLKIKEGIEYISKEIKGNIEMC